jgi:hypothetical protein
MVFSCGRNLPDFFSAQAKKKAQPLRLGFFKGLDWR